MDEAGTRHKTLYTESDALDNAGQDSDGGWEAWRVRRGVLVIRGVWYGVYKCVAETSCGSKETGVGTRAGVEEIVRTSGLGFDLEMCYWFGVPCSPSTVLWVLAK